MKNWCKILSTLLIAGSMAFAQYGYDDDEATESADEPSYSYGSDESAVDDDEADVGKAKASGDEWEGFRY
jgi:hypothetical protein